MPISKAHTKKRKKKLYISLIVLLILIGGFGYVIFKPKKKVYILGTVQQGNMQRTITIQGALVPNRKSVLTAPYNGYVKKIYVQVGQKVKAGQSIISVVKDLQSTTPVFPITSPYDGVVTVLPVSEGSYVAMGDTTNFLAEIDDLSSIYVNLSVSELNMLNLRKNQTASIQITSIPNKTYKGVLTMVSLAAQVQTQMFGASQNLYPVRIKMLHPTSNLRPGFSAVASIVTATVANALYLPQQFIYSGPKNTYFVIRNTGKKQPITIGLQTALNIQIIKGLKKGDKVRQVNYADLKLDDEASGRHPR